MAINIQVSIDAQFLERWMTAKRLKEILNEVDDNFEVVPNSAGNLMIYDPKEDREVGYIDFHEERFVVY